MTRHRTISTAQAVGRSCKCVRIQRKVLYRKWTKAVLSNLHNWSRDTLGRVC